MSNVVPLPVPVPHHAVERTRRFNVTAFLQEDGTTRFTLTLERETVVYTETNGVVEILPFRTVELPHEQFINTLALMGLMPAVVPALDAVATEHP